MMILFEILILLNGKKKVVKHNLKWIMRHAEVMRAKQVVGNVNTESAIRSKNA